MLKKALSYFFILFGLAVLWASTSRRAMQYISEARDCRGWWCTYPCIHGDLVSMSYLDIVDRFKPPPGPRDIKRAKNSRPGNIALYLCGDSYTRYVKDTNFTGLSAYYYIDRNHGYNYHLDSTKRNILLIEISERYLRLYFNGLQMLDEVCDSLVKKKSITWQIDPTPNPKYYAGLLPGFSVNDLFNKYINQNLQCNLFNYNFMMPMFESKAAVNYYLFNRASGDVVISEDRQRLFLKETVTNTGISSSYAPVGSDEIKNMVNVLNVIYDHYKKSGFTEVYFSVIPNSATIMQPRGYNNVIPLLQNDPNLRIPVIDIYTAFKKSPEVYYLPGDTHWNKKGCELWLDIVNDTLSH
jgi:hypothetical protein